MLTAETAIQPFAELAFEEKLDRLAEVAVRVGLNLRAGQELILTASTESLPLVRRIAEHAYKAGAKLVLPLLTDDPVVLARYGNAPDLSFDYAPQWLQEGIATAFRNGAARLAITGNDPSLLSEQDPTKVSRANTAASRANKPAMDLITRHEINWTIVASATPAWAAHVFPRDLPEVALAKLWDAIFYTSRITSDDPFAEWQDHGANLKRRVDLLNSKRFHSLRFFTDDGSTDLTVGLADRHLWAGGGTTAGNGVVCQPNIPTEECFTTPHKDRVNGHRHREQAALAPRHADRRHPLHLQGADSIIKGDRKRGGSRAEQAHLRRQTARAGLAKWHWCRTTLPSHNPACCSGAPLFDENAASHIALGQAYSTCLIGGEKMSNEATRSARRK